MSECLPVLPNNSSTGQICCFPAATFPTPTSKRRSRLAMVAIVTLVTAILTLLAIKYGGDTPMYFDNPLPPLRSYYSPLAMRNEDCDQVRPNTIFLVLGYTTLPFVDFSCGYI